MKSFDWTRMHWKDKKTKKKKKKKKHTADGAIAHSGCGGARRQATGGKCGTTKGVGCCWKPKTQWPLGKSQLTKSKMVLFVQN